MDQLMNPEVVKSEHNARKETNTSKGSQIAGNTSNAAEGCERCHKIENDLIECRKKLERTQRQLTKANDYNEDLRKQIHCLSSELHEFRSKSKHKTDVGTQAEFNSNSSLCGQGDENIRCKNYKQDADSKPENLSIADELKQAAEEAVQETGYVYDESSGLYYDKNTGYYYNHETAMHYDPYTGTYYTYDSYSGTYIFHSQVDPSYLQQSNGGPTSASSPDYYKSQAQTPQDSHESDTLNKPDSFKDYRDPGAMANATSVATSSKKNKKRKSQARKEKTCKAQKVEGEEEKSEMSENLDGESEERKEDTKIEVEDGEILAEMEDQPSCPTETVVTLSASQLDVVEDSELENQFLVDETELQGLNRKQRREKIRLMKKAFEERKLQGSLKSSQRTGRNFESPERMEKRDELSYIASNGEEQERIETGYSMFGCDELCSTSGSSTPMEETSTHSDWVVSDSNSMTKNSTCSPQANLIQGSVSNTMGGSEVERNGDTETEECRRRVAPPVCRDCGQNECKIHVSHQEETLYPGNLSDDTQNAVDYDFVTKVKHEISDDHQDHSTGVSVGTCGDEDSKLKDSPSVSSDLNKPVEQNSTLKCSSNGVTPVSSSSNRRNSSKPGGVSDKGQSCDELSESEDSGPLCTSESELESGELTESSEESDGSSDEDMIQGEDIIQEEDNEEEDQDPHSYPPCIRLIVTDSDQLDYGSLFIITCDGGTIGREKNMGNVIIIPDTNISRIHAQLKYDHDARQYHLIDFGSQNGTFLNEQRISESKCSSSSIPVNHGDSVQIGCTRFLLHIHYGNETCDQCEPGQVQAAYQAQKTKDIPILSKEEKKQQARQELNQIKKKYGLKNAAYVENNEAVNNANYRNRAEERRQTKGSDNPHQVDEAPASVHRPITENNVGHKLLKKMGWSEGESLGKDNTGIQDPVSVSFRVNQKAGLGSTEACSSSLDNIQTTNKSRRWLEAQKRYKKAMAEKQISTPAWVKSSPKREDSQ